MRPITIAVMLRKRQAGVGIADEHDGRRIAAYCRLLNARFPLHGEVILPAERAQCARRRRHDAYLFIGADDETLGLVERLCPGRDVFLWGKGYRLTIDDRWQAWLPQIRRFFNSCYLSGFEDRYNERTRYLPTAFHEPWPAPVKEKLEAAADGLFDSGQFDVVFSGSGRMTRPDQYRQELLNRLAARGLRICVAAPRSVWDRPHKDACVRGVQLDPSIRILGRWGTERLFARARCALDLPWLDTVFACAPPTHDLNNRVWALGWNVFRMGGYGANLLTYDCPANRELGLDESNCLFYRRGIGELDALADEIAAIISAMKEAESARRRENLRTLFHARHRYLDRWTLMFREMAEVLAGTRPAQDRAREPAWVEARPGGGAA